MELMNIYKKGIGLRKLQIYSDQYFEFVSTFKTKGFRPKECIFKSSIVPCGEILINTKYKSPGFFSFKSGSYFGNVIFDDKNIGEIEICDDDECYVNIKLISGSMITVSGETGEKSCSDAYVNNKDFCIIVKYNNEKIIEIDNPKINQIKLSSFNKIASASSTLFKNEEKDIILQTIPIFHFFIFKWYIVAGHDADGA